MNTWGLMGQQLLVRELATIIRGVFEADSGFHVKWLIVGEI